MLRAPSPLSNSKLQDPNISIDRYVMKAKHD